MHYRELGRTGWKVSAISFGAWAIGSAWGSVDDDESAAALRRAVELGVNFFDTADVYGDGHSERLLAQLKRERKEEIIIATKAGRRLDPHVASGYNRENLTAFIERSLKNLDTDCLDLVQLHCPPTEVYYMPETFGVMDDLVKQGKIRYYGVSVEKVEEALKAIEYPNVQTVQIIYNIFRQRPADLFFARAQQLQGRYSGAAATIVGDADGQTDAIEHICGRRSSAVQSTRRVVRSRRDLLGRGLRSGTRCSRRTAAAGADGLVDGGICAALDSDGRRRDVRDSGRAATVASGKQLSRRRPAAD